MNICEHGRVSIAQPLIRVSPEHLGITLSVACWYPAQRAVVPPSFAQLFRFDAAHPHCYPCTVPESLRPLSERDYHALDGVLLIVFFSHARYDVNLDFYREVYAKYFPNVSRAFAAFSYRVHRPASREDAGFAHSFDVVLNSYHSDEDLAIDPDTGLPTKMAGRMAHHMLYQALAENPCGYDGYLWAPFDTLLNVPRLQQFDQTRFWYHSPWAQYVPNPGAPDTGNVSHAPAATISPELYPVDPADRYKQNWWWGSKEYGLEVCVPALENVPLRLRERLAEYNGGTPRLIGGSPDTTTCFFEIATPTTLHLVAPRDEPIMFVDHWWIWYPPSNTSFVRQKWAQGSEVDTFHTFRWGDPDADGVACASGDRGGRTGRACGVCCTAGPVTQRAAGN
ncbi:hypothetical protein DFH07DRAFT_1066016 [Mycena maculata]|uniref:Uncharacterized protein n=1 Tax=Mycena maculata TaxID=230809 RepID=A0AAD7HXA0_9AGAR|nr:hypothetical protein DFH07DRAFT_1066016 [Mycena maculata]